MIVFVCDHLLQEAVPVAVLVDVPYIHKLLAKVLNLMQHFEIVVQRKMKHSDDHCFRHYDGKVMVLVADLVEVDVAVAADAVVDKSLELTAVAV